MNLKLEFQHALADGRPCFPDDPRLCRARMRIWARCWRQHRGDAEQFHLAELALGNALGWRDRGLWAMEN
jgi:hypothetical protein